MSYDSAVSALVEEVLALRSAFLDVGEHATPVFHGPRFSAHHTDRHKRDAHLLVDQADAHVGADVDQVDDLVAGEVGLHAHVGKSEGFRPVHGLGAVAVLQRHDASHGCGQSLGLGNGAELVGRGQVQAGEELPVRDGVDHRQRPGDS
ncbi:hypothetical protein ACRJ4B_10730 [Streptomyces sp. GTA36]